MAADFTAKIGSLANTIDATLTDATGAAVDLTTGVTDVRFTMTPIGSATPKVNAAVATIVTPAAGRVRYAWVAADLDTAGLFLAEWTVTYTSGAKPLRFPERGHLTVEVQAALA